MEKNCPNCNALLTGEINFCPQCGQKTILHRLTLHEILHELVHYFTHANKSFPSLLKALVVKNGRIAREYIAGKRKTYFPPLNFFLLVATIFVFIATLTNPPKATVESILKNPKISMIPDPIAKQRAIGFALRGSEVGTFMSKYANVVAMIATPIICFIYWLFYRRIGYTYMEHLVACFYMVGFGNLAYVLLFIPLGSVFGRNVSYVFLFLQAVYNSVYYYHFINRRSRGAVFKATAVSFFSIALWGALVSGAIWLYITKG